MKNSKKRGNKWHLYTGMIFFFIAILCAHIAAKDQLISKVTVTKELTDSKGTSVGTITLLKDGIEVSDTELSKLTLGLYDLEVQTSTVKATIKGINVSKTLSLRAYADVYSGTQPNNAIINTPVFVFNDTGIVFEQAEIVLEKSGVTNVILHCANWNFNKFNCNEWESPSNLILYSGQNATHIWFNVTDFASWGAGKLTCDSGTLSDHCIINTSVTITDNGYINGSGNLTIAGSGDITAVAGNDFIINMSLGNISLHSGGKISGNTNITAVNVVINSSSSINVNAKGSASTSGTGEGADGGGADGAGGAGYGGKGGNGQAGKAGGSSYGSITQPLELGSGGGAAPGRSVNGGVGGGAIFINATDTVNISGSITANGGNGGSDGDFASGGGSGGSIYLTAETIVGNGSITANGGNGGTGVTSAYGGGGAGGRIAIYYTNKTHNGAITTTGGTGPGSAGEGGAGTIFQKASSQTNGELTIDNTGVSATAITPINITVDIFNVSSATIRGNITVTNTTDFFSGTIYMDASLNGSFNMIIRGTLTASTGYSLILNGTKLIVQNSGSIAGNANITVINATIESGGSINANAKGYAYSTGTGKGADGGGGVGAGGAGYGGSGGAGAGPYGGGAGGIAYGSITQPIEFGSGGGDSLDVPHGGTGGGTLFINVSDTLNISGSITATGGDGEGSGSLARAGGGGSGGSMYIVAETIVGNGSITANGGNGGTGTISTYGGGGGGGRIAIYYTTKTHNNTITTTGGTGPSSAGEGGTGSIFIVDNLTGITESLNITTAGPNQNIRVNGTVLANNVTLNSTTWGIVTIHVDAIEKGNSSIDANLKYDLNFTSPSTSGTYMVNVTFLTYSNSVNLTVETAPTYSNFYLNGSNTTNNLNDYLNWTVNLSDDNGLSYYVFMDNSTGSFANNTFTATSGTTTNISTIKQATKIGEICGKFWFNNTVNKANLTDILCVVINDTKRPAWTGLYNNGTILLGTDANWTINLSDNIELNYYVLMTNASGSYINETFTKITGTTINISATKTSLSAGRICARFWFNDTHNNANLTSENCIAVTDYLSPVWDDMYVNGSNATNNLNDYLNWTVNLSDDNSLSYYTFMDNNTGSFANNTFIPINTATTNISATKQATKIGEICGKFWFNDTHNNANMSDILCAKINDFINPTITLISPSNNTGDSDSNITFNYNVTDDSNIANCSLIINGITNQTNNSITKDTTQNFTLNDLEVGRHNWSINCTDSLNNRNSSETRKISVIKIIEFSGDTTDLLTVVDVSNITNLIIEQLSYGKINFSESVDLSSGANIDSYVNISFNKIELNSTALPELNKSAILYLYGLTYSNPRILRDNAVCPSTICTKISYSGGNLTFNATQFSVYSSEETPVSTTTPTTSASTGGGGGGGGSYRCTKDSDCNSKQTCFEHKCKDRECTTNADCEKDESCWNYLCVKLFDMKIIRADSPIQPEEFLDFTYLIKGVADIDGDVIINFWLEKDGKKATSGSDTIYLGSFEEKTETTSIFLPIDTPIGSYEFYVQVNYGTYKTSAHRTIQVGQGVPLVFDIELSELPSIKQEEMFEFSVVLSSNKDAPVSLHLEEKIKKGDKVVWSREKDLEVIRSKKITEKVGRLEPENYQLELIGYYDTNKTSRLSQNFDVRTTAKDFEFYAIPVLIGLVVFILSFIIYWERKKINVEITKEEKWIKRHKVLVATLGTFILFGLVVYYLNSTELISLLTEFFAKIISSLKNNILTYFSFKNKYFYHVMLLAISATFLITAIILFKEKGLLKNFKLLGKLKKIKIKKKSKKVKQRTKKIKNFKKIIKKIKNMMAEHKLV